MSEYLGSILYNSLNRKSLCASNSSYRFFSVQVYCRLSAKTFELFAFNVAMCR